MPVERYYSSTPLKVHTSINLTGNEFHHLSRVMRGAKGQTIELVDGKGNLAEGIIQNIGKDKADIYIEKLHHDQNRPITIVLAQGIPKPNRIDFILEKGTELGIDEFCFFPGELSVKDDFSSHQMERMQAQTIAAMKQCGRLYLPEISIKPPLKKWGAFPSVSFFGDTDPTAPPFLHVLKATTTPLSKVIFFVGPESGFSTNETDLLKKHAQGVKLHENILRTDTASLTAASLIGYWIMDNK